MLRFLQLLVTIVLKVTEYMHDQKLMEAGAAKEVLKGVEDANVAIRKAMLARTSAHKLPVESDPNNRDNGNES